VKLEVWVVGSTIGWRGEVPGERNPAIRDNGDDDHNRRSPIHHHLRYHKNLSFMNYLNQSHTFRTCFPYPIIYIHIYIYMCVCVCVCAYWPFTWAAAFPQNAGFWNFVSRVDTWAGIHQSVQVTCNWTDDLTLRQGWEFSVPIKFRPALEPTKLPIQWISTAPSPRIRQAEREAEQYI